MQVMSITAYPATAMGSSSYDSSGGGNGYTDDDLLASLASFGVEGQTERDLATIKAMMLQNGGQLNGHQYGIMPQNIAQQSWSAFLQNANNPPPNTPTLSKSLELQHLSWQQQQTAGFLDAGSSYGTQSSSNSRRRDVSLDRSHRAGTDMQFHDEEEIVSNGMHTADDDAMDCGEGTSHAYQFHPHNSASTAGHRQHFRRTSGHRRTPSMGGLPMEDIAEERNLQDSSHQLLYPQNVAQYHQAALATISPSPSPVLGFQPHTSTSMVHNQPTTRSKTRAMAAAGTPQSFLQYQQ